MPLLKWDAYDDGMDEIVITEELTDDPDGPGPFTAEDYWNLPAGKRAELINGKLYDMAPPSWDHQQIAFGLARALADHIDRNGGLCKVCPSPVAVNLTADDATWVEPDVIVVCDPAKISKRGVDGAPDFVAEVVSPSSISMDYFMKAGRYQSAGVREYWIVDPAAKQVVVYRYDVQGPGFISCHRFDEPVTVGIFEGLTVTVADFL